MLKDYNNIEKSLKKEIYTAGETVKDLRDLIYFSTTEDDRMRSTWKDFLKSIDEEVIKEDKDAKHWREKIKHYRVDRNE
jgi:hypothetical protein